MYVYSVMWYFVWSIVKKKGGGVSWLVITYTLGEFGRAQLEILYEENR